MRRRSFLVLCALVSGCHPQQPEATPSQKDAKAFDDDRKMFEFDHEVDRELGLLEVAIVWPTCQSEHPARRCGMLYEKLNDSALLTYAQKVCKENGTVENLSQDCIDDFRDSFLDQLRIRYYAVDREAVRRGCVATNSDCSHLALLEVQWIRLHNERVISYAERGIGEIEANRATALRSAASDPFRRARRSGDRDGIVWNQPASNRALSALIQLYGASMLTVAGLRMTDASGVGACTSDLSCDLGSRCVKPPAMARGTCVASNTGSGKVSLGEQDPRASRVAVPQCWGAIDCAENEHCDTGACVKTVGPVTVAHDSRH